MLTEEEKEFVKGKKSSISKASRYKYNRKIQEKVENAVKDLSLIANEISSEDFGNIFTKKETKKLIKSLLLPNEDNSDYNESYSAYKSREDFLLAAESYLEKWYFRMFKELFKPVKKQLEEIDNRFGQIGEATEYYIEQEGDSGMVEASELMEVYDKEVKTEERILRNCYKWMSKKEITEATDLERDIVDKKVDELLDEGKLKRQKNGWRYKRK